MWRTGNADTPGWQAVELRDIALKVRDKYCVEPQRESAIWARKHQPDLARPLPGLPPQALPATMPSLDFRLVWHTGKSPPAPLKLVCFSTTPGTGRSLVLESHGEHAELMHSADECGVC